MEWIKITEQVEPYLKQGKIDICVDLVTKELKNLPESPFHAITDYRFTNSPLDVSEYLDDFINKESKSFQIGAVYAEMNGFDVNPDLWYFDLFAYETYGGHDDYDWLSHWQSEDYESKTLTGLEDIQIIYENFEFGEYEGNKKDYSQAKNICSLLIVLYFQDLIKKSATLTAGLQEPLLATAHDYDFIFEFSK